MTRTEAMEVLEKGREFTFQKTVSESDVYLFAGITGDFHNNHINAEYANTTQLGARVAHGALLIGFVSAVMGDVCSNYTHPGSVAYRYDMKFIAPVYFGDTIKVICTIGNKNYDKFEISIDTVIINQKNQKVSIGTSYIRILKE